MTTFFEYFLQEIARKLDAGEIDEEKAARWFEEIKDRLSQLPAGHPLAIMPIGQ